MSALNSFVMTTPVRSGMPDGFLEPVTVTQTPTSEDLMLSVRLCCLDFIPLVDVREFSAARQGWLKGFWLPAEKGSLALLAGALGDAAAHLRDEDEVWGA